MATDRAKASTPIFFAPILVKQEPPLILDWNGETQFLKAHRQITAASGKRGDAVEIHYRPISFRNPLLTRVVLLSARSEE